MGRKENRRNQHMVKMALATAIIGLAASLIDLLCKLIDWLNR